MGKKSGITIFFLMLMAWPASAQYISRLGRFQVDQIKGCAPLTITITNANLITTGECTPGKPCLMDYEGNGTQQQNTFTYTYATAGTFKLSVLYQSIGADDITVTVLPNIQPAFQIYSCSNDGVYIKVTDKSYDQYFIDFGDGSPVVGIPFSNNQVSSHTYPGSNSYNIGIHGKDLNAADNCNALVQNFNAIVTLPTPKINTLTALDASRLSLTFSAAPHLDLHLEIAINGSSTFELFHMLYGVSVDTATNLSLSNTYYCFRLSAYDPCSGANTYSNTICSQLLTVTAQSDVNQLSWVTSTAGVNNYSIIRNQMPYIMTPLQQFSDTGIICLTNYCYQLVTNYANGSISTGLPKCVNAFSSTLPTPIENASSVVGPQSVELTWLQDPKYTTTSYLVNRSQAGSTFQNIASVATQKYDDAAYTTQGQFCYQIGYSDQCANPSLPGSTICPIRLTGTVASDNIITLEWNRYTGWKNGVLNYTLNKYNPQGSLIKTFSLGGDTTFVDSQPDYVNQIVSYEVTATANDKGLTPSVSNTARFIKFVDLFYPTAFTPNNDKLNDSFVVSGHYIAKMELSIFDRWGNLIFITEKNDPWDGTYNGKLMPETTYAWLAKGEDIAGQTFTRSGSIILLKKAN
jgi:gliding motility-associated-like protein